MGSNHHQASIEELSIDSLNRQIKDLYHSIKKVQMYIDTSAGPLQNQMISTLGQCVELLKKKCVGFEDKENNTSYTISLQLDVSNELTEWAQTPLEDLYPHIEQ